MNTNMNSVTARYALLCLLALSVNQNGKAQLAAASKKTSPVANNLAHGEINGGNADIDALLHHFEEKIQFTQNQGQFSDGVLFRADFPLGQALVTRDGMVMKTYDPTSVSARAEEGIRIEQEIQAGKPARPVTWRERGHAWMMQFEGASSAMHVESIRPYAESFNYFLGDRGKSAADHL